MSRMWEVDPETRTKLLQISKTNGNDRCCDCGAPSPQWASPKFGTFICLNCAGTHRGLGVHISFVRSITMDAFKHAEIQRMELGGNEPWKAFYDAHTMTISEGRTFEDSTIKERYEGDAGEEWKERLSCKVEGRDYVPGQEKKNNTASRSTTPLSLGAGATTGTRTGSPAASSIRSQDSARGPTKKEQNEQYFSKLGSENAGRSNALPPSQGGKFTGFGGGMPAPAAGDRKSSPLGGLGGFGGFGGNQPFDEFQKDPMGTLTKGLGWFASTVGKSAKQVNDSYLQPTAKQLAESDFAAQARVQAASWGQNLQTGVRGAADQFNRFVEGEDGRPTRSRVDPDHSDFWDDFSSLGDERQANANGNGNGNRHQRSGSRSDVIGTAAMRKGPASTPLANSTIPVEANATSGKEGTETGAVMAKGKDDWDDNW
ncbi:Arf GTPase activating protein [Penicillium atrosanguineum]|uniref:Arf GTPase activating protein n=1 Tax=Penicillium atrosanguineum TaxID=1132637 RepID=A0A9W9Q2R0_9EURO|nr:Arf GTPase activating protein [Penicillium atrosanguineum]KAJ5323518.1 Arf GTPase activating protein [Penicillium atrosanguineum]